MKISELKTLITHAKSKLGLSERDVDYKSNRLLEIMQSGLEQLVITRE